ncbi:MAG: galactokinase [Bacteroidetes bacterium]|nr:MAG: galactokinase [Bacteroidota bacterium]
MKERIHSYFQQHYSAHPLLVCAPGRVNLIGEHTDYNQGFVLPAAVDKALYFALAPNGRRRMRLYAHDLQQDFEVALDELQPLEGGWPNYLMGVVAQLQQAGHEIEGFDCVFGGNIPQGAGMSSSAALECGLAFGLNQLFGLGLDRLQLARIAQLAEHTYAGVQCGIMDQYASLFGKAGHAIKLDCRSLSHEYIPFDLPDYRIVLCNTGVSHSLADSAYNQRRQQCETGLQAVKSLHPQVQSLRDVSMEMLQQARPLMDALSFRRCAYVLAENQRLQQACEALRAGDLTTFGQKMYESHQGLSEEYEVSCEELDLLVALTRDHPAVVGARMMGGGFGGCTINLVQAQEVEAFCRQMQAAYQAQTGILLQTYVTRIEQGVRVLAG